ncbi:unnamed protein product, partial [Hapterophycus canaliculatus]
MPASRSPQQRLRGPWSDLHSAAISGCTAHMIALLSRRPIAQINRGDPKCRTPLLIAAGEGHTRIVQVLLERGANPSVADDNGLTPLLIAAQQGHLPVTKMLVKAGENLEQLDPSDRTPLHIASITGKWEVVRELLEAGADPNTRVPDGRTPLYSAAEEGHVCVIRELLRAKADPSLGLSDMEGAACGPLDGAAERGQSAVVNTLIQQLGLERCGGASGGRQALRIAAREGHLAILMALTNAGVLDMGEALTDGAASGHEGCVKFLLRQQEASRSLGNAGSMHYVNNTRGFCGLPPLASALIFCSSSAPRIVRILMDAGVDATSTVSLVQSGVLISTETPLDLVELIISEKRVRGRDATKDELLIMKAIRRLLLREDAVHAVSWLWQSDVLTVSRAARTTKRKPASFRQLARMLPIMRQSVMGRRVALASLFR